MVHQDNSVELKLSKIENSLERIESKMDNFIGFEILSSEEEKELEQIRSSLKNGEFSTHEEVFE
jgi:hypothetical protein